MALTSPNPLSLLADRLDPKPDPLASDPVGYVQGKGAFLVGYQREIAAALVQHRRVAVPSCFDSGKSFLASALAAWWIDTHPVGSAFVATTAPTNSQVKAIMWREIQSRHAEWELPGRITLDAQWKIGGRLVAFGRKPSEHSEAAFQGIHDDFVLVIIDEGAGVPASIFEQAEGLITNANSRIVVLGNPADPMSQFATICKPGSGWFVKHISAFDTPNFTGEDAPQAVKDRLISKTWVAEAERRFGRKSFLYVSKVLGEFPDVAKDTLIEPRWILAAQRREVEPDVLDAAFGADIARYGDDMTIVSLRQGGHVRIVHEASKSATTTTAGAIRKLHNAHVSKPTVNVDDDGIGGGVTDMLDEQGVPVVPIHNGGAAHNPLRFGNRRAEMWWTVRELLAGHSGTGEDGLLDLDPDDDELAAQLGNIKYKTDSRGRIWVETKEEMRKRKVPSPDRADSVVYSCVDEAPFTFAVGDEERTSGITDDLMERAW